MRGLPLSARRFGTSDGRRSWPTVIPAPRWPRRAKDWREATSLCCGAAATNAQLDGSLRKIAAIHHGSDEQEVAPAREGLYLARPSFRAVLNLAALLCVCSTPALAANISLSPLDGDPAHAIVAVEGRLVADDH